MIIKKLKVLDIESIGDVEEGDQAGIAADSLPFMFEILSTQFYANPIGSIIREITSNCLDAHTEAGIEEPIIIRKGFDEDEGHYIEFQDFGVGMSVDRIYKVYMNYFSSTKRDSNVQIGGFGLGSKTPLSYADFFYITTVHGGKRYDYLYHKGESMPTIESMNGYEMAEIENSDREVRVPVGIPTEERNGTSIKIIIEAEDIEKFKQELSEQLTYFDNVYFEGWAVSNVYTIYEGKYFKFRSNIDQNGNNVHICIGNVKYNIDMQAVNVPQKYRRMPIAVKFEIGELQITPNRESIRYSEEGIKLVQERILQAAVEIASIYNKQNPEIETLQEYLIVSRDKPSVVFSKEKGHNLFLWPYTELEKEYRFKPLSELQLAKSPKNLFFNWAVVATVRNGTYYPKKFGVSTLTVSEVLHNKVIIMDKDSKLSKYTDMKISNAIGENETVYVVKKKDIDFYEIDRELGLVSAKKQLGKARTIYNYNKIIDGLLRKQSRGNYKDYKADAEWIANYRKGLKEATLAFKRKQQKKVFVKEIEQYTFHAEEVYEWEIEKSKGIIVYGFKEDRHLLELISTLVTGNTASINKISNRNKRSKAFVCLQIAKSIEKVITGAKKVEYCRDFAKTRFFRRMYSLAWLAEEIKGAKIMDSFDLKEALVRGYTEDMTEVRRLINKYANIWEYSKHTYERVIPDGYTVEVYPYAVKLFGYLDARYSNITFPLENTINSLPTDLKDQKEYIDYLKYKKLRLPNRFYLKDKRQLEYEANVKHIIGVASGKIKEQFLLTIKLEEHGNNDQKDSTTEEE